jgi:oligo-1,6-glucosidase
MVSRWGHDGSEHRDKAAKMLHTFLLSMRATPFVYCGDEIGMANIRFDRIEDYRDLETINWYALLKSKGEDAHRYLEDWKVTARDNGRTPFQWSASENAGFTTGTPWIRVNEDCRTVNVEAQEPDPDSVLNYFRRMVRFRKQNPVLVYGDYTMLSPEDERVYAYVRTLGEASMLVVLSFSSSPTEYRWPDGISVGEVLMNNSGDVDVTDSSVVLQPYQAVILQLNQSFPIEGP